MADDLFARFMRRVLAVLHPDQPTALAAIAGETEPQVLTQAADVSEPWRLRAISRRLGELDKEIRNGCR